MPSARSGLKWRWKALTTLCVSSSKKPVASIAYPYPAKEACNSSTFGP